MYSLWPRRLLQFTAVLLSGGIVVLCGVSWRDWHLPRSVELPPRLVVPLEEDHGVWEPWRRWIVQDDGRAKPFDTFCREAVRTITGRERFGEIRSRVTGRLLRAGHLPVAVVVSWMLHAETSECNWEQHPFLLCQEPGLRQRLRLEPHGLHVAPAQLRDSAPFREILLQAAQLMSEASRSPLPRTEAAALELKQRLDLYDRLRAGGEVEEGRDRPRMAGDLRVAALDPEGRAWFSLRSLRAYSDAATPALWEAALKRRRLEAPPGAPPPSPVTFPLREIADILRAYSQMRDAYASGSREEFADASAAFLATLDQIGDRTSSQPVPEEIERELWYNHVAPFQKAWMCGLLAALLYGLSLLVVGRWSRIGSVFHALGFLAAFGMLGWACAGFFCRVTLSGRPPVGTMYESLIWVAFVAALLGLLFEGIYHHRVIALAGALVATLGFLLADALPMTFSPSLQPLEAVLRSNYWLIVHVLVIVSSYAPLALAWSLGNVNLALILFAPGRRDLIRTLSGFCYRAIQVGVLLLFLGTMLGGFWAAESWGRFWGWDPKEVWALVAFLCYMIPLHARYVGWVGDFGLAVCSVVCFASVVMAWYGVNYVLGAGLHSYGFGSGDNTAVLLVGLVNLDLVVLAALSFTTRNAL